METYEVVGSIYRYWLSSVKATGWAGRRQKNFQGERGATEKITKKTEN